MQSIYSTVDEGKLLHQFYSPSNQTTCQRLNISPEEESLQVSFLNLPQGTTFRPHKHIIHHRDMPMAQESWVVIRGSVEVYYYDLNDVLLQTAILNEGDITITYAGGHNYLALKEPTLVYEFKTGPYLGQKYDKVFLKSI